MWAWVLAAAIGGTALSAVPAVAKRGHFTRDTVRTMEANIRGSNGYGISLFGNAGYVYMTVSGHHATVSYTARGRASGGRIKARFGRVGRVSLEFHRRGVPHLIHEVPNNCTGEGRIVERGVFTGRLRFDGEMQYASVHASHLRGKLTRHLPEVCDEPRSEAKPSPIRWTELQATSKDAQTIFDAFKFDSGSGSVQSRAFFVASVVEPLTPKFSIIRTAEIGASSDDFEATREKGHVTSATVEPPAPFSGTATYLRSPPSSPEGWTGSLAVELPGIGKIGLTGPGFCAESERPRACSKSSGVLVAVGTGE
jgi:hypothetical protein